MKDLLAKKLYNMLQISHEDKPEHGVCQFILTGTPHKFYITFGQETSYADGSHADPTTTIILPFQLLAQIIEKPDSWDQRDTKINSQVTVKGDPSPMKFLTSATKKPAAAGQKVFHEVEALARQEGPFTEVERVDRPTDQEIIETLRRGKPMVATGCLDGHEAWSWDFEEIQNNLGHLELLSSTGRKQNIRGFIETMNSTEGGSKLYSEGCKLSAEAAEVFQYPFFPPGTFDEPRIWMGSRTGDYPCTSLHRDIGHAFLGQVRGRKRFIIYPPDQAEYVYPFATYNIFQPCHAQPWDPDYEKHPLFKKAKPIDFILHPGELAITPSGWFHCVFALDPVISISYFLAYEARNWQLPVAAGYA